MLATLIGAPFDDPDWVFETKWDGYRVIAKIEAGKISLLSRRGTIITGDYPRIVSALAKLRCLVPAFDGAILSFRWKEALWDKFFMAAPRRQRRSVEQYKIVKRA
jgi:ATP-dependent DNA ligase